MVNSSALGADCDETESFRGRRWRAEDPSLSAEVVRQRRPLLVFFNNGGNDAGIDAARDPWLAANHAQSAMAAPLLVAGEVVGAIAFLRRGHEDGADFDDHALARVAILTALLGPALEALRLNRTSRQSARQPHPAPPAAGLAAPESTWPEGAPDMALVMETVADRLRGLLHSPVVLVFCTKPACFI